MNHIRKFLVVLGALAGCAGLFGATQDIKVEVYRETRAASDPFGSPETKTPESTYELVSTYLPKDEMEKLVFSALQKLKHFRRERMFILGLEVRFTW